MSSEAGANPLGHACLLFSTQDKETSPVLITNCFGFYSLPATKTNFLSLIGIKFDLQGGHGILKREIVRELDGKGLNGKSFELTKDKFNELYGKMETEICEEQAAIKELDRKIKKARRTPNGQTRLSEEKDAAIKANRPSRLHAFQLEMKFSLRGFDSSSSHSCKTRALNLLQETKIIDANIRYQLEGGVALRAFPRFSGDTLHPLRLVSTGAPTKSVSKKTGRVYYNRTWRNPLFFASSMNLHKSTPPEHAELKAERESFQCINRLLSNVQTVENALRQAMEQSTDLQHSNNLTKQLDRVQGLYDMFSNSSENSQDDNRTKKKLIVERVLNVATMSMTPERVNYSFFIRMLDSMYTHHALLGLIGMIIVSPLLAGIMGATVFVMATLYTIHNMYGFYKEQSQFETMKKSYQEEKPDVNPILKNPTLGVDILQPVQGITLVASPC